jgi:proline iminopeptidase
MKSLVCSPVPKIVGASFRKAGQVCTSVQIALVQRERLAAVTERLTDAVGAVAFGDPSAEGVLTGPLISEADARRQAPHGAHPGNRSSSVLLMERLDPAGLGALVALYEHKVFVQSVIWGEPGSNAQHSFFQLLHQGTVDVSMDFIAPVAPADRGDMLGSYHRLLTGRDELRRLAAAKAWSVWEGRTATLLPDERVAAHFAQPHVALSMARIECHYFMNDAFLRPNQLLEDAGRLEGIPGLIVHGRYDAICPVENAWELHHAWSGSELSIVADAGHSAAEPATRRRLVEATDRFASAEA